MKKQKYRVFRPHSREKLVSFLDNLFSRTPRDHYIVKLPSETFTQEMLGEILRPFRSKIEWYKKEKSIIFVLPDYDPDEIPEFIGIAPTELEASDMIDFEEIERELGF